MIPFLPPAAVAVPRLLWRCGAGGTGGSRMLAEETPVALVHDGTTTAVMMATPADLEDFAIGFSLCEGIVTGPEEIEELVVTPGESGLSLSMWLRETAGAALERRRRRLAGPVGCGLCGIESLAEAARPDLPVATAEPRFEAGALVAAVSALAGEQRLHAATHAAHAAAFWEPVSGRLVVREDVGRHNALDKLAGALARRADRGADGAILLTSRVSVEMVQKAARIGAPVIAAVSAPTALALRTAERAGITLVAVARGDGFEIFTGGQRIRG